MNRIQDLFATALDRFRTAARVEAIFGEPQTHHGRTVIPVGKVFYAFGLGAGEGLATEGSGGGGGAVRVQPVGVLIISEVEERFVPFRDWRSNVVPALGAFAVGFLVGRRVRRRSFASPASHH